MTPGERAVVVLLCYHSLYTLLLCYHSGAVVMLLLLLTTASALLLTAEAESLVRESDTAKILGHPNPSELLTVVVHFSLILNEKFHKIACVSD